MVKTAKITQVVSAKTHHSGNIYHNLVLDNGDKINIGKKKEQKIGWDITYEIIDEQSGEYKKSKPAQAENGGGTYSANPMKNDDVEQNKPQYNGKYQQKDSEVITMLSCISSACTAVAQSSSFDNTKVILLMAEDFYKAAMAKKPQV